ncbi:unnamed protein product [Thlaspi arvense]|uniref:Hydrophobic seed protein domain-containing protein n=1 Tax=Thlaspi arvense TaxID=13288 RepID=A0AAU9T1S3_THLAR|nr:unnamed protein product [Thlaspi arvense]
MASKNITTIMALYLTFNLVLLGFTSAQPPVAQPDECPIDLLRLDVCADLLVSIRIILPSREVTECCTLLAQVGGPAAAVCACEAASIRILNIITVPVLNLRVNRLLSLCPGVPLPPGGVSCN